MNIFMGDWNLDKNHLGSDKLNCNIENLYCPNFFHKEWQSSQVYIECC